MKRSSDSVQCYLCESKNYIEVLRKGDTDIWTNACDQTKISRKYLCGLNQCTDCGHVYQPLNQELEDILQDIYRSAHSALSTSLGEGNWGINRAEAFLKTFSHLVDLERHKSVIELGCDNGYLLRHLQREGIVERLIGIEPSLPETMEIDGITFLKEFADNSLKLEDRYDLIFSFGVFEHIANLHNLMKFCQNNMSLNGELFFCVPNAELQLNESDPALFSHQHVHCFTKAALYKFLKNYGFSINKIVETADALKVLASLKGDDISSPPQVTLYKDYQGNLKRVLQNIKKVMDKKGIIVHGANNTLNNISSWLGKKFDFVLVDNDTEKIGKIFFNSTVQSLKNINLKNYNTVLITTNSFFNVIKADYIKQGFSGEFVKMCL